MSQQEEPPVGEEPTDAVPDELARVWREVFDEPVRVVPDLDELLRRLAVEGPDPAPDALSPTTDPEPGPAGGG